MHNPLEKSARIGIAVLIFGLFAMPVSWARWKAPEQVPVGRLLKNVRDYVQAHPKEAHGYYILGRINSAAFARDAETIPVYTRGALPDLPPYFGLLPLRRDRTKPLSPQTLTK